MRVSAILVVEPVRYYCFIISALNVSDLLRVLQRKVSSEMRENLRKLEYSVFLTYCTTKVNKKQYFRLSHISICIIIRSALKGHGKNMNFQSSNR